jgi:NTE family protein
LCAMDAGIRVGQEKMLAFVLSGGGNRGPLEVGALQVLLEHGIVPDMLVGTSAGAINAAFLAIEPTVDTALALGDLWQRVETGHVFQGNRLTMLWRFVTGKDSLYRNESFERLMAENLPPGVEQFGDMEATRLYIVATRLDTGEPRVFGHDPRERLLDGIMSSAALPPFLPPWRCGDELLIDGGISADLPVKVAVSEGAKEIYALHLVDAPRTGQQIRGVLNIAEQAVNTVLSRQLQMELEESESQKGVTLHYVPLTGFYGIPLWDFSHTAEMIEGGRQQMQEYLESSCSIDKPERFSSLRSAWRQGVENARRTLSRIFVSRWFHARRLEDLPGSVEMGSQQG